MNEQELREYLTKRFEKLATKNFTSGSEQRVEVYEIIEDLVNLYMEKNNPTIFKSKRVAKLTSVINQTEYDKIRDREILKFSTKKISYEKLNDNLIILDNTAKSVKGITLYKPENTTKEERIKIIEKRTNKKYIEREL